jgi:predicted amidophosphoribosyltransferase
MVVELKKTGSPRVAEFCAKELAGELWGLVDEGWLVSWIPSAGSSEKGFDHGEVLARAVSWHLGLTAERLFVRKVPGEAKSLGSRARHHLAKAAIDVVPARKLGSYHGIVLIDDVATTGASLVAAADRLKAAGGRRVVAATITHTPLHRRDKERHRLA